MRIGIGLPNVGVTRVAARAISTFAHDAEEAGFACLWGGDRLFVPKQTSTPYPGGTEQWDALAEDVAPNMDPFVVSAAAMAGTDTIRFSWSTLNAPTYHPVHLARALTSLDVLSEGRLDCGFGLGWMKDEFDAVGNPWGRRGEFFDDVLDFLRVWWSGDAVEYRSPFLSVPACHPPLQPAQAGGPAILLAGLSVSAMRRVGRRANGWLALEGLPAEFDGLLWTTARRAAEQAGRDPEALERIVRVNAMPGETVDSVVRRLDEVARSGADEAIVDFGFAAPSPEERFDSAQQVLTRYRD